MRTIKFRAWDISRKCFAKQILTYKLDRNNNINLIVYLDKVNKSSEIYENDKIMCNEFNLMQFTGLLDKNGKDVYEGDIIKSEIYEREDTGTIEWSNDGLYIVNGNYLQDYHFGKIEIIGNIYENDK